jgi:hypothetical protein
MAFLVQVWTTLHQYLPRVLSMKVDSPGDPCDEGCSGVDANGDGTTDTKGLLLLIGECDHCD